MHMTNNDASGNASTHDEYSDLEKNDTLVGGATATSSAEAVTSAKTGTGNFTGLVLETRLSALGTSI